VHEEEVPRDGVSLTRRPVLARWSDGSWHAWIRREKAPGIGESSSGLAFDTEYAQPNHGRRDKRGEQQPRPRPAAVRGFLDLRFIACGLPFFEGNYRIKTMVKPDAGIVWNLGRERRCYGADQIAGSARFS
jgi:hypothetical protein